MTQQEKEFHTLHPIQLVGLRLLELSIIINPEVEIDRIKAEFEDAGPFSWNIGHSEYDDNEKKIGVKATINIGGEDKFPFKMTVSILGIFEVDEAKFPLEHINSWAIKNAPLILYPYLREQAYSLTSKAGFPGVILPLLQVPTFKINRDPIIDNPASQE